MFDVGFSELVILFVIGLLILGPERLPRVASQLGRWIGRARRTASQLRHQLEREMALNDLKNQARSKPWEERRSTTRSEAPENENEASDAEEPQGDDSTPQSETSRETVDRDRETHDS
jgi:sec-independent protein translocase protein TatB